MIILLNTLITDMNLLSDPNKVLSFPRPSPRATERAVSTRRAIAREFDIGESSTFERLAIAVRSICPRWLSSQSEDLAQRAAVKVLEQASRGNLKQPICASYLNRIAMSVVIDEIRYRRRRPEATVEAIHDTASQEPNASMATTPLEPDRRLEEKSTGLAICECLQRLGNDRRLAVTLGLQGYAIKEIAQAFDWTEQRAKNLYYRGRRALQTCLRSKGFKIESE